MAHLVFNSPYEFYNLPEERRIKLIGRVFRVRERVKKGKKTVYTDKVLDTYYVPIGLAEGEHNYGVKQGVLRISAVIKGMDGSKWFRVGAFSPDDLDIDLDFNETQVHLRQEVIDFIKGPMHKQNRYYREALRQLQERFGGEITS